MNNRIKTEGCRQAFLDLVNELDAAYTFIELKIDAAMELAEDCMSNRCLPEPPVEGCTCNYPTLLVDSLCGAFSTYFGGIITATKTSLAGEPCVYTFTNAPYVFKLYWHADYARWEMSFSDGIVEYEIARQTMGPQEECDPIAPGSVYYYVDDVGAFVDCLGTTLSVMAPI